MANHFNELLLQTLKEVGIRLERLEGRVDHVINEKADKEDIQNVKADINDLKANVKEDINDVKVDINDLKANVKEDINDVKVNVKEDINDVKVDINDLKANVKEDINDVNEKLDQKADKADVNILRDEVRAHGQRLDRIETGIRTLQWTMTAGIAVLGIILAFVRSC